jgi:hypothetical protein
MPPTPLSFRNDETKPDSVKINLNNIQCDQNNNNNNTPGERGG